MRQMYKLDRRAKYSSGIDGSRGQMAHTQTHARDYIGAVKTKYL